MLRVVSGRHFVDVLFSEPNALRPTGATGLVIAAAYASPERCQAVSANAGTTSQASSTSDACSRLARMRVSRQMASRCLSVRMLRKLRARSRNTRYCGVGALRCALSRPS